MNSVSSVNSMWTTIARKHLVGITGIGLVLFLVSHAGANLFMLFSAKAYNMYGHSITSLGIYPIIAWSLVAAVVLHLVLALYVHFTNTKARPQGYASSGSGAKKTSFVGRSLWMQGLVIIVFFVLHLLTFKYGTVYTIEYDGVQVRDLFRLVVEVFQSPVYVVGYVIALLVLGMHLGHGIEATFRTFGLVHPRYTPVIKKISVFLTAFVTVGFIIQPLYMFFIYKG